MKTRFKLVGIIVIAMVLFGVQPFVVDEVRAEESQTDVLIEAFGDLVSAEEAEASGELVMAPDDRDLGFNPVTPCRIVDTRAAGGYFFPGVAREYYVYGSSPDIAPQGGNPAGCPAIRTEPSAVHMNVTAVPISGSGNFRAYPANVSPPNASLTNYRAGVQNVANAATIKCYRSYGPREIEVLNSFGYSHLVIDVMGYYYANPYH